MPTNLAPIALATVLILSACGSGEGDVANQPGSTTSTTSTSEVPTTQASPATTVTTDSPNVDAPSGQGLVTIRLQEIDGIFIEGFEAGIRIETITGEVLYKSLWSDFVSLRGDASVRDYYDSVLEQTVPSGEIVVLATVNVGSGPAPVRPDINGEMACKLVLDVPADAVIDVELSFDGRGKNCLSVIELS